MRLVRPPNQLVARSVRLLGDLLSEQSNRWIAMPFCVESLLSYDLKSLGSGVVVELPEPVRRRVSLRLGW